MPEVRRCRDQATANSPRDCKLATNRSVNFQAARRLVKGPPVGTFCNPHIKNRVDPRSDETEHEHYKSVQAPENIGVFVIHSAEDRSVI